MASVHFPLERSAIFGTSAVSPAQEKDNDLPHYCSIIFAQRTVKIAESTGCNLATINAIGNAWKEVGVLKDFRMREGRGWFMSLAHALFDPPDKPEPEVFHIMRSQLLQLDPVTRERANQAFRDGHCVAVYKKKDIYSQAMPTDENPNPVAVLLGRLPD